MKLKNFDRFQHYFLDGIWTKIDEGKDVPNILELYSLIRCSSNAEAFADELHHKLRDFPAIDPDNGQWRTWGFVIPFPGGQPDDAYVGTDENDHEQYEQHMVISIPGTTGVLFCVEKRERVLPSASINDKVAERVKELVEREQREANKKDWAMLKDEVIAACLKTAPVRRSRTFVLLWERSQYIFTASQKSAEETNKLIRHALTSWPAIPAYSNEFLLKDLFKKIVLREENVADEFVPGGNAVLMNEERERITVKDSDLEDSRYPQLIEGEQFLPIELQFKFLTGDVRLDAAWVKMNIKGDVKAIQTTSEADDDVEIQAQHEKGSSGYLSKLSEIWLLMQVIARFSDRMEARGVMTCREDLGVLDELDGDIKDADHQVWVSELAEAAKKALAIPGHTVTVTVAEPEEEEEDDDTFDLPDDL